MTYSYVQYSPMNDLQLSFKLALAIGWTADKVKILSNSCLVNDSISNDDPNWVLFDYNDPNIIFPIASKYGCGAYPISKGYLPSNLPNVTAWDATLWSPISKSWINVKEETLQKTIAIAIIQRNTKQTNNTQTK